MKATNRSLWEWLQRLLGPCVFLFVLHKYGGLSLLEHVRRVPVWMYVACVLLFIPITLAKSIRWQAILSALGLECRLAWLFDLNMGVFPLSVLTPGRVGEVAKVAAFGDRGRTPPGSVLASILLDRLSDLTLLVLLGTVGVCVLGIQAPKLGATILWGCLALVVVGGGVAKYMGLPMLVRRARALLQLAWSQSGGAALTHALLWTLLMWSIHFLSLWFLAREMSLPLGLLEVALVFSAVSLLGLLPVTVAGMGTREVVLLGCAPTLGISTQEAMALSGMALALLVGQTCLSSAWAVKRKDLVRRG